MCTLTLASHFQSTKQSTKHTVVLHALLLKVQNTRLASFISTNHLMSFSCEKSGLFVFQASLSTSTFVYKSLHLSEKLWIGQFVVTTGSSQKACWSITCSLMQFCSESQNCENPRTSEFRLCPQTPPLFYPPPPLKVFLLLPTLSSQIFQCNNVFLHPCDNLKKWVQ